MAGMTMVEKKKLFSTLEKLERAESGLRFSLGLAMSAVKIFLICLPMAIVCQNGYEFFTAQIEAKLQEDLKAAPIPRMPKLADNQ